MIEWRFQYFQLWNLLFERGEFASGSIRLVVTETLQQLVLQLHREIDAELRSRSRRAMHLDMTIVLAHD